MYVFLKTLGSGNCPGISDAVPGINDTWTLPSRQNGACQAEILFFYGRRTTGCHHL